eukprot:1039387-Pleurochrysis_carterae.AAC.5
MLMNDSVVHYYFYLRELIWAVEEIRFTRQAPCSTIWPYYGKCNTIQMQDNFYDSRYYSDARQLIRSLLFRCKTTSTSE